MRIMGGSGSWKLKIEHAEGGGISILKAVTGDERAVIPEYILGECVTCVADHAFLPAKREPEEDDILIGTSAHSPKEREKLALAAAHWDNSNIRTLTIPGCVTKVGNYAFHNLGSLETLGIGDSITSFGSGAVSGCRNLRKIYVECRNGDIESNTVPAIAEDISGELEAVIQYGEETAKLIFPEYHEVYEETPHSQSQYLVFHLEGAGYCYHHSFARHRLSFKDYDGLFEKYLTMGYELDTAVRLAWQRLRYPVLLARRAETCYKEFLAAHPDETLSSIVREGDGGLELFFGFASPSEGALRAASHIATKTGRTEMKARLLLELHERFPKGI